MKPVKDGPKRFRRTRRELPYGQVSLWGRSYHMKRDLERVMDQAIARADRLEDILPDVDCYGWPVGEPYIG